MIALACVLGGALLLLGCCFGQVGIMRLARLQLSGRRLVLLAALAQLVGMLTNQRRLELLLLATLLLAAFCWLNRRLDGFGLISLGVALNVVVIASNGGVMPISSGTIEQVSGVHPTAGTTFYFSKDRVLNDDEAILPWLGDRLFLPGPLARLAAWSLGDLLMLLGVGQLLLHTMKGQDCYDGHDEPVLKDEAGLS